MKKDSQKSPDILDILRHHDKISSEIRAIEYHLESIRQNIPRAADEIERLRKENQDLKNKLKDKKKEFSVC
jgi:regulator of replication initiation timing